jgi:hypothetical protein
MYLDLGLGNPCIYPQDVEAHQINQSAKGLKPELSNSFCTVFPEVDNY